ncbi:hypothetical protein GAP32_431A [Cronobacter phage vB_CsaM_GAP32]|uniref:Putative membrane protein n=1 Tax=Cronobacter phage vB_CsaM_GAP32 TaxID=1141136 RepID=K4F9P8_9CAUD|nr:hypothetical protein GAP32_431A [Cronobacter phage vB_CsaM_GAP32]AFC21885.1 putative membrane protein [Cronobacter phage vB_CsaM_GAP32]
MVEQVRKPKLLYCNFTATILHPLLMAWSLVQIQPFPHRI